MIEKPISFGGGTINDRTYESLMVSPYYYIDVRQVDGLWAADISYESHPIPGRIGEVSGDVFRRGKTVVMTGTITARGLGEYRSAERYLHQMFWGTAIQALAFTLWNDGFQIYVNCRVNQDLVIAESKDNFNPTTGFRGSWTISLRADNPRTYKVSDNSLHPSYQT